MCRKIRCDVEYEKFCKIFWELNTLVLQCSMVHGLPSPAAGPARHAWLAPHPPGSGTHYIAPGHVRLTSACWRRQTRPRPWRGHPSHSAVRRTSPRARLVGPVADAVLSPACRLSLSAPAATLPQLPRAGWHYLYYVTWHDIASTFTGNGQCQCGMQMQMQCSGNSQH